MTTRQKIELKLSELRSELSGLAAKDSLEEGETARLEAAQVEYREGESKLQAAILSEPETKVEEGAKIPDAEERERLELRSKARAGDWIAAAITGRTVSGPSAEFAAAEGVVEGIPLALFEPEKREQVETRSAPEMRATTPAPTTTPIQTSRPTVPAIFERSVAASLGVSMPMVQPGQANYPKLTTAPTVGTVAKDAAALNTAGAFSVDSRTPERIAGEFTIRLQDVALFPSMENDLRGALTRAVVNQYDAQVIGGNGTSPNLAGLFHTATDVTAESTKATFASGLALFAALVDGTHARSFSDIRAIAGTDTFAFFASLFRSNGDVSLWDYLTARLGLVRVSNRVPDAASMAQKVLVVLGGEGQNIVVPVWSSMTVIVDPYSAAGEGLKTLTATALVGSPFVPHTTSQVKELHPKIA